MCYFHAGQNNEKYLEALTKGGKCGRLKVDIEALQHCENAATFEKVSQLFAKKWENDNNERIRAFIQHFKDQCLVKYPGWFEVVALGYPSTYNGLKDTNGEYTEITLYARDSQLANFYGKLLE